MEKESKKETELIGFVIPKSLRRILELHVQRDTYLNLSDFLREAIREKLQREAPDLYQQILQKEREVKKCQS